MGHARVGHARGTQPVGLGLRLLVHSTIPVDVSFHGVHMCINGIVYHLYVIQFQCSSHVYHLARF